MKPRARFLPSTGALLVLLVALILLAARWGPGSRPPHSGLIAGLTYEFQPPAAGSRKLVVTSVEDDGPAAAAGIAVGDVIESIDDRPVAALADVSAAAKRDGGHGIQLIIRHEGADRYMRLPAAGH